MTPEEHAEEVCRQVILETDALYKRLVRPRLVAFATELACPEPGPAGYEPVFGPPIVNPEIFFIGFQPGGGPEEDLKIQPAERKLMWPAQCAYATEDWKLACMLRKIFPLDLLMQCTGSERQFFRAKNTATYQLWPKDLRLETEAFCMSKLKQIFHAVRPKRVLFIGKAAMVSLMPTYDLVAKTERGHFLVGRGSCLGVPGMACTHLSGVRLLAAEMAIIKSELIKFIEISG